MRIHPMRSDMQKEILTIVEGRRLIDQIEARDSDVIVTEKREIQLSNILKHFIVQIFYVCMDRFETFGLMVNCCDGEISRI